MTRLTEALERAQAAQGTAPAVTDSPEAGRDVPAEWQFQQVVEEPAAAVQAAFIQPPPDEPLASFTADTAAPAVVPAPVVFARTAPGPERADGDDRRPEAAAATDEQLKQKLVSG